MSAAPHAPPPTHRATDRAEALAREVFFIIGAPRSGTTLVQAILSSHPRLFVPPETEFFMKVPTGPFDAHAAVYLSSRAFAEQAIDPAEFTRTLADLAPRSPQRRDAFLALLLLHAERSGRPRIGEKSPHHCRHVEEIRAELPGAKFIHILRDPRDVIASRLTVPWTTASHITLAKSWAKDITRHDRLLASMPADRYTQLRLEDLIHNPEAETRRLCAFLGEDFHEPMLRFHERADAGFSQRELAWKGGTLKPLDPASIGRFRSKLAPRQIHAIQRICAEHMHRHGYAPDAISVSPLWPLLDAIDAARDRARKLARSIRKRVASPA